MRRHLDVLVPVAVAGAVAAGGLALGGYMGITVRLAAGVEWLIGTALAFLVRWP
jgi:hypothetical protein